MSVTIADCQKAARNFIDNHAPIEHERDFASKLEALLAMHVRLGMGDAVFTTEAIKAADEQSDVRLQRLVGLRPQLRVIQGGAR